MDDIGKIESSTLSDFDDMLGVQVLVWLRNQCLKSYYSTYLIFP